VDSHRGYRGGQSVAAGLPQTPTEEFRAPGGGWIGPSKGGLVRGGPPRGLPVALSWLRVVVSARGSAVRGAVGARDVRAWLSDRVTGSVVVAGRQPGPKKEHCHQAWLLTHRCAPNASSIQKRTGCDKAHACTQSNNLYIPLMHLPWKHSGRTIAHSLYPSQLTNSFKKMASPMLGLHPNNSERSQILADGSRPPPTSSSPPPTPAAAPPPGSRASRGSLGSGPASPGGAPTACPARRLGKLRKRSRRGRPRGSGTPRHSHCRW
jgi:hypothetical protein